VPKAKLKNPMATKKESKKKAVSDSEKLEKKKGLQEEESQPVEQEKETLSDVDKDSEVEAIPKEESELDKLTRERDELQEKYLRLYSDFENYRRRTSKEKIDLIDHASEKVLIDLLPILDDFERAMQSMAEAREVNSVCEGVNLIFAKLKKSLEDKGLHEIDCLEKDFDPEIHEALTKIPAPKKKLAGKVVDQIQKGYSLNGKVIRHSKVVVGE
jgi:molecular chaperone GrpE